MPTYAEMGGCTEAPHTANDIKKSATEIRKIKPFLAWNKKVPDTGTEKFKKTIEKKYNIQLDTYWDLQKWSVENRDSFWSEIWNFFDVICSKTYDKVFVSTGPGFLDCKWFTGATFNYAENLLRHRDNKIAIAMIDENETYEEITYAELYQEVGRFAAAFKKNGLKKGDVVCCILDNRKEAIIGLLAAASIGAIFTGIQLYYGIKASAKIAQKIEPKFLFAIDCYLVSGEIKDNLEKVTYINERTPSIEKCIIMSTRPETVPALCSIKNSCTLHDFLDSAKHPDGSFPELIFEQVPFDHPLHLVFTSGTTGLPKAPVHGHGSLITVLVDTVLHWNLKEGDTLFSSCPMGWALWNFLLPALAQGVKMFLFRGSEFHTFNGLTYWDLVAKYRATWFFVEPSTVDRMEKRNLIPAKDANFDNFKYVFMSGSPVKAQNVKFIQEKIKKELFVGSLYGSTESHGYISGFDQNLPIYAGEIQAPALGKEIKCFNKQGCAVVGELGELVVTTQSPSFPVRLWKDDDRSILNKSYLTDFPGVWCPRDECWINPKTKGIIVVGRSDNVLLQASDNYGPADVYFAIHDMEEITDYICVSHTRMIGCEETVRTVLFVKLANGLRLTAELRKKIERKIEQELWEELVPRIILDVPEIPYNVNGKRMEMAVKKIIATNEIAEFTSIRNPECLVHFQNRPELASCVE